MSEFYIESADRPYQSGIAASDVDAGELVHADGAGVEPATFADGEHDGVALYEPEYLSAEDEDATASGTYSASNNDRVPHGGNEDAALVKVRTAEDTGGNEPTPTIGHETVVGIIDTSAGTLSSTAEYEGRLVEEGYDDGESTPTTYNRSNGNFMAIGKAVRPNKMNDQGDVTAFDEPVRVELWGQPQK